MDDHIGVVEEPLQTVLAFGAKQIERNRPFAAIEVREVGGMPPNVFQVAPNSLVASIAEELDKKRVEVDGNVAPDDPERSSSD